MMGCHCRGTPSMSGWTNGARALWESWTTDKRQTVASTVTGRVKLHHPIQVLNHCSVKSNSQLWGNVEWLSKVHPGWMWCWDVSGSLKQLEPQVAHTHTHTTCLFKPMVVAVLKFQLCKPFPSPFQMARGFSHLVLLWVKPTSTQAGTVWFPAFNHDSPWEPFLCSLMPSSGLLHFP